MNESKLWTELLINWNDVGDSLDGWCARINNNSIYVYEPSEDEEEGPDKHIINRDEVSEEEWNKVLSIVGTLEEY